MFIIKCNQSNDQTTGIIMITPSQVSESLNVPASTIRRWAARFEKHLSPRKGKKRSYTISDLDTFRKIRDLSNNGHGLKKIAEMLDVVEIPEDQSTGLMNLADFVQAFEMVNAQMLQLQDKLDEQNQKMDNQDQRIKDLEDWINTPFYKRIGKKPPIK
jgi:DNA-binding transcriptional MerR regulator